jgi:hypothetical protein
MVPKNVWKRNAAGNGRSHGRFPFEKIGGAHKYRFLLYGRADLSSARPRKEPAVPSFGRTKFADHVTGTAPAWLAARGQSRRSFHAGLCQNPLSGRVGGRKNFLCPS